MAASLGFRELILEWAMNIGAPVRYTTFYLSFHESDPGTTGAGESAEVARTSVDNWAVGTVDDGIVQNSDAGTSPACTQAGTVITHFGVYSAVTAGDYLFGDALTGGNETLGLGEKLSWGAGDLTAQIS